ncbi:enoyl-CoA hydratase/isomerase family protein [Shewanella rhizosphaerae]|uniref:3-hydroxyacyl-CoA dehydrogenase NAD-binding domain-containing protein n=1 Tax=Shewanella rhizosphaerae TaxID=2864207 RepID=UPI001C661579|nr:3-hydroxyacyl-CoA dehydrogenase NAD-binding domain-containing protein [Shewanella rhizosphaerae]QYK12015.1 enoyl-CoA hydratase/isomerase family protein [Shewanella rhizosphaerae]
MTNATLYQIHGRTAVIVLNQPPVNSLGLALRTHLLADLKRAEADESVDAIVLASSGKLFCGGADISEFSSDDALAEPNLPQVCDALENSPKLVIAAVNGLALGGGCELTLACDYRIALPAAKLGLPEVNLGILPGAGGTQRLPRIGGVQLALEMITSGRPLGAAAMLDAGVIDNLYQEGGDFIQAAVDFAQELVAQHKPKRSCFEMSVDTRNISSEIFNEFRAAIARRSRGYYAPERCIQAVEAACELPLAEGLKREHQLFMECLNTPQARAQQHLFFAERGVAKIPGIDPKTTATREIRKVAVIGSGTMGGGIAMNFINVGIPTQILDLNGEALERGLGVIRKNYEYTLKKGKLSQAQLDERMALLSGTTDYADIADVDLVIEAVFEKMEIKKQVFKTLDATCKPGAILATNTSTLDVDEIAAVTSRPQDVLGLHFFSPANVMRLLEIVRANKTAPDALLTTVQLAQRIKKVPVVSGVCWGFIGNRATDSYLRESMSLILEGASPAQIDKVHTEFGMPMGLPSMVDLAGIDVGILTREDRKAFTTDLDPSHFAILHKLYDKQRYGQKTGRGLYIYEGRDKQEDPEVLELAAEAAKEFGVTRRSPEQISDQEILERTIYPIINEGARILEEGIALRASDIDIVLAYGFGFPIFRGGPMQYADEIGLETVLTALNKYRDTLDKGELWFKPAPLLERLVREGKTFAQYQA